MDEQVLIEITPNLRMYWRYWGWEVRYKGALVGSVVPRNGAVPTTLTHIVTTYTKRLGTADYIVVDLLASLEQVIDYLRVNEGYMAVIAL